MTAFAESYSNTGFADNGNVRKTNEISIKAGRSRAKDRDAKYGAPVNLFGTIKGLGLTNLKWRIGKTMIISDRI